MPNIDLAKRVLDHILRNPREHKQDQWRCQSGMCFAGWACVLSGAEFVSDDPDHEDYYYVRDLNGEKVPLWDHATDALGIDILTSTALFEADNTIQDLELMIAALSKEGRLDERWLE